MPLNPSDPAYIAEITPASIAAMERPLCSAFGVGLYAFGAKGNTVHLSGYHRSRQWILNSSDSRYGSSDYSVTRTLDQSGDWRWVSAFDFTPGAWGTDENRRRMRLITSRVYVAAVARDPRLSSLREFAGTLDGRTVVTFNCADGSLKSPFDSSHLDHVHGSFWRSRAATDHTGIVEVMLGTPTGVLMALTDQQQTDLWEWVALLVDPGTPPAGRPGDRFKFPPTLFQIKAKVDELAAGGVDPAAVAAAVVEQIGPQLVLEISGAQLDAIAEKVADRLAARLAS
jgi:hypothetical protein